MISSDRLRRLRNDLPMAVTLAALGDDGPPTKIRDGRLFFLCPHCGDLLATINPRNNLAHCFGCSRNLNNIDLLRLLGYDFPTTVAILERLLQRHQSRLPTPTPEQA